jgi:hypothetical protein
MYGLGGLVEKLVVSNVEKSYDEAAAFTAQWTAARRSVKRHAGIDEAEGT